MIVGESITFSKGDGSADFCDDFSFRNGFHYISFQQRELFDILSLQFTPYLSGSLEVDNVCLQQIGFLGGIAKTIELNIKNLGQIVIVFFLDEANPEKEARFKKTVRNLKAIKLSAQSQQEKIKQLGIFFSGNPGSYLLLDLNNDLNFENRFVWETILSKYTKPAFFLLKNLYKANSKTDILKKELHLRVRLPMMLFAFFSTFLSYIGHLEQTKGFKYSWLCFLLSFLMLSANFVYCVAFSKKEITKTDSIDKLLPLEGLTALFNAAGFFISLFISLLIAYISSLSMGVFFTGSGMVVSILEDFALLFFPFAFGHFTFERRS